jgi:hypothetical protein
VQEAVAVVEVEAAVVVVEAVAEAAVEQPMQHQRLDGLMEESC